jgi:hypothetical protein
VCRPTRIGNRHDWLEPHWENPSALVGAEAPRRASLLGRSVSGLEEAFGVNVMKSLSSRMQLIDSLSHYYPAPSATAALYRVVHETSKSLLSSAVEDGLVTILKFQLSICKRTSLKSTVISAH